MIKQEAPMLDIQCNLMLDIQCKVNCRFLDFNVLSKVTKSYFMSEKARGKLR